MTAPGGRLDRLYPALTAKERALLVLSTSKKGGDEDPQVRRTMPQQQIPEFNRLIDLIRGVSGGIAVYIGLLKAVVGQLSLRFGWLCTLHLWALNSMTLAADVPLERRRKERRHAHEGAKQAPATLTDRSAGVGEVRGHRSRMDQLADILADRLRDGIDYQWQELRACELVLEEVSAEFDGEDVLRPPVREMLDGIRKELQELHEQVQPHVEPFELREPDEELVETIRELMRRAAA